MDTAETRTCKRCGEDRPLDQFSPVKSCKGGRRPICTPCRSEDERKRREEQGDLIRERDRIRNMKPGNRERRAQKSREWYAANRERALASRRDYYERHPEQWEVYRARRHAKTKGVRFTPYQRRQIFERDGGICRWCRKELTLGKGTFHIDHIVPVELDGPSTPDNLQLMCPTCNREKWNKLDGQIYLPV